MQFLASADTHVDTFTVTAADGTTKQVTFTITGTITVLTAPRKPVGPQDITVVNIAGVFTAGTNQARFQTAKTEITRVEPDGTVLTSISGKSVEFTGLQLQTNLETGETIMINEPRH